VAWQKLRRGNGDISAPALCVVALLLSPMSSSIVHAAGEASTTTVVVPNSFSVSPEQESFLDKLEHDTFTFFWESTPADTGLTPDRLSQTGVSSIAAVGFALTSYTVAADRRWVTRSQAAARALATLRVLWRTHQGPDSKGTSGYRGFYYHFIDTKTGLRSPGAELSTVDTALLMAGVLSCQAYFTQKTPDETSIRRLADQLYRRVDWPWASSRAHAHLLSMGWTPEQGWLDSDWRGYNEAMILYILALGSPAHAIDSSAWPAWTETYRWDTSDGFPRVAFDPLFGHQYSHIWIDFRKIQDAYMREKGIDYFVNSTRATYANQAYCVANPAKWAGYDDRVWGLTASDGPGQASAGPFRSYWARGAGPDNRDDGTIAVTAAGGSVPFAPELTIPTLTHLHTQFGEQLYGKYGFKDAFNLSFSAGAHNGWFSDDYVAIDQGPILLMIENFRSSHVWRLMRNNSYVRAGLTRAGFTGGWLAPVATAVTAGR
jgi:hypothetical protein